MTTSQHAAVALIGEFLASLYQHQDLAAHLETYHPDAWVLLGDAIVRRADLDPERYEAAVVELLETARPGAGGKPALFEALGTKRFEVHGDEALLLLTMQDLSSARPFEAAFKLRVHDGEWRFLGCTVLGEDGPSPTFINFDALNAGELAQAGLVPEPGELLLTPLDLAYRRAYPRAGARLISLPETRFTCQNSGECCKPSWDIPVPDVTRSALESVQWEALAPEIPRPFFEFATAVNAGEPNRIASHEGACSFHRDNTCTLHKVLGYAPVPVCATYPIGFTATPDGVCVWTYFTCPTARSNVGELLADREADIALRARTWRHGMLTVPETLSVSGDETETSFEVYQALEASLLDVLADTTRSLDARLGSMLGAASAVCALAQAGSLTLEAAREAAREARPLTGVPVRASDGLSPYGVALYLVLAKHLPTVFEGRLSSWDRLALHESLRGEGVDFAAEEEGLTRYARQVLFRKKYLGEFGIVAHLNTVAWSVSLVRDAAIAQALHSGRAHTTDQDLERAFKAVERSLTNSELIATGVLRQPEYETLLQSPLAGLA